MPDTSASRKTWRTMGLGVYMIRCLATGKVYIGSSENVANRLDKHIYLLRRGCHHSRRLQRAWDKYGPQAFDCDLVDPVYDLTRLREAEQFWINRYDSYRNGYNGTTHTGQGSTIPAEVKAKMSVSAQKVGTGPLLRRKRSEAARAQHAAGKLGRQCWKPGTAEIVAEQLRNRPRPDVAARMRGNQHARKH